MKSKSWAFFCLLCLFFIQLTDIQAQKISKNISISWTDKVSFTFGEDKETDFLHFDGAVYLQPQVSLPSYYERIPVDGFRSGYDVKLSDVQTEAVSEQDVRLLEGYDLPAQVKVSVAPARERGKNYAVLSFVPIVRTAAGQYRRVTSLVLEITGHVASLPKGSRNYAARSVLSQGQWFSFTLAETGIYKVTYEDLVAMGMPTPIYSDRIAIFGNGGKMLPEANAKPRTDDLRELPIMLYDNNDGIFGEGDYFIFYGESPHTIEYDTSDKRFTHATNIYADVSCYFVTASSGVGAKKRIATVDNSALSATASVSEYTYFDFHEDDLYNFGESGKDWFGDLFDITTERSYTFTAPGQSLAQGRLSVAVAGVSNSYSTMRVSVNGNAIGNVSVRGLQTGSMATLNRQDLNFTPNGSAISVTLTYSKPSTSSSAYLNWIEVEMPCSLTMNAAQFSFCNPATVREGSVTQFNIGGADQSTQVWDVTDPSEAVRCKLALGSGTGSFKANTDVLRRFVAFDGTQYLTVTRGGAVENQNLHATGAVDMVIVTHPDFLSQANRLANFRQQNDGLKVKVATIQQVYNEFSGGSQDPIAIRDYMKMIYDKTSGQSPKYLLLVGRPCYDYRGRVSGTEIFVPNYQYAASGNIISEYSFYANDDTFGLLDDEEGANATGLYDIAIGRFPCSTLAQATTAVDKSIRYTERRNLVSENSTSVSNFGDWRNVMAFVADDEDYNDFISNADNFTKIVEAKNSNINFDKIYLDAYSQVSNAGGQRYPDVTTAINNRMNRGCLFYTYIGHSGKDGWTAERVLENSDINKWANKYNMPAMLTLSCTFGFYDRPAVSPAELAFFNSNGGVSAIITASREAWSSPNNSFGRIIFGAMFDKSEKGRYPTIGEIEIAGKNNYGGSSTSLAMFVLMGDPSMPLAIPTYRIVTDSVNRQPVGDRQDTVRALSRVTVSGRVVDDLGQTIDNFNGTLFPSVYDKKVTVTTLANDPTSQPFDFESQKSILFKGNCTVSNGHYTFSFYVPKDIDYKFGQGKMSYYARTDRYDAAGAFTGFIIGGVDSAGVADDKGPEVELFLNDENFVEGGITNQDPVLIAKIKDNYGINTTGNGIGHDLVAILDDASESQIVLNDYYQTEKDSFNVGTVRYSLSDISVGKHKIMVRAWDINNNPTEAELSFEVVSDETLTLSHVLNYPNPFTTRTAFFFEQNQNGGEFDIQVQIYTISGKLLKTINTTQLIEGNRCAGIPWDGLDDYGDKIGRGVYMYRLRVRNQNGEIAEKIEKLVIL